MGVEWAVRSASVAAGIQCTVLAIAFVILSLSAAHSADIELLEELDGVRVIAVAGDIVPADYESFTSAVTGVKSGIVILNSVGGSTGAAIQIGKFIRLRGYATAVVENGVCLSACAMIWLGGNPRFLHEKSILGFHASYVEKDGSAYETGAGNALVGAYYNSLGLSEEAIYYLTKAPPNQFVYVDPGTAEALGITILRLDDETQSASMKRLRFVDLYGFDYARLNEMNLDACQRRCEAEPRCNAYTFNKQYSVCFLKSDARIGLRHPSAFSGYSKSIEARIYLSNLEIWDDTDLEGGDYRSFRGTFGECFVTCSEDDACRAFSWVSRNNSCWLKSGNAVRKRRYGVASGAKAR
jgi:hypothetical protein